MPGVPVLTAVYVQRGRLQIKLVDSQVDQLRMPMVADRAIGVADSRERRTTKPAPVVELVSRHGVRSQHDQFAVLEVRLVR